MAVRWQFIEDREADRACWTWCVLLLDGTIERQSQRFNTYGAAVGDAIRHGFRPSQHHWIVVTRYTATHFPPSGQEAGRTDPARPSPGRRVKQ